MKSIQILHTFFLIIYLGDTFFQMHGNFTWHYR